MSCCAQGRGQAWRPLAALAVCLLVGCAHVPQGGQSRPVDALVTAMRERRLELQHPLTLEGETVATVRRAVGAVGSSEDRLRRAVLYLNGADGLGFQYEPNLTLTAEQAFQTRRGDCMSYALLLTAIAREVGVATHFVYVDELPVHYDADGVLYTASHIAVGLGKRPDELVVDFAASAGTWSISAYRRVDDLHALALFYSNRAVDRLVSGDARGAERILRELMGFTPEVREVHANLGVALLRTGQPGLALTSLRHSLQQFPTYQPLWTHAIRAARALGHKERVQELEAAAERVARNDPYFQLVRGITAYREKNFRTAITSLEGAAARMSAGVLVRSWLVRAYLAAGEEQRGLALFSTLLKEAPRDPVLAGLAHEFPPLALLAPPAPPTATEATRLAKGRPKRRPAAAPGLPE
jgi:Transglutaminase-like superfamily